MEIDDNNNNQDSDTAEPIRESDDPTLELESPSVAAQPMSAEEARIEEEVTAETIPPEPQPASHDMAAEIQRLRDELKYRADMNSILQHRNDRLREKCGELEERIASLLRTSKTLRNELERSHQEKVAQQAESVPDPDVKPASAAPAATLRESGRARRITPTPPPGTETTADDRLRDSLVLLDEHGADSDTWILGDEINVIGSGPDCDIRLASRFVSRHHAQLVKTRNGRILEDLDSTNGTYINARRISKRAIRAGDLLTVGKLRLQYRQPSDKPVVAGLGKLGRGQPGATRAPRGH